MKKYIDGYYCQDPEHLEPINTGYKRQILELFRESYPEILTKQDISTRTSIDEGTVDNIVKALAKNGYIERREKKRFLGKPSKGNHRRGKPPWTYSFENLNFTLNEEKGFQYQFAPGSFQYNKEFLDMYRNIVDKTDQDNIHRLLIKFLKDVFTNVSMSKEDKVRKMKPEFKKDFICSVCGLNHEVRDFIRAMLLHLVDQLEITDQFVEFLRNKQFVNEEAYDKLKSIRISTKGQLITDKKKGVVALRILSINKSVGKESSPFLALNRKNEFVYGHIDNMLVSDDFNNNNLIECIPTILDVGIHSSFIHLYQGDYIRKIEDDPSFPSPKYSKIEEIKHSPPPQNRQEANIFYIVEGFIVYQPTITERFLHGQKFSAIDTIIGDGTGGDIRLVGHYNEEIELHQGDRIKVFGAWAEHEVEYIYDGDYDVKNVELRISPYGSIVVSEKKEIEEKDRKAIFVNGYKRNTTQIPWEIRQLKHLKDNLLLANAEVFQNTVEIAPAEGVSLNVNTAPFKSFFLNRILEGMRSKDMEKVSQGQISELESLNYGVEEDDNGLIKRILIINYREKERLIEILKTSTWVFTRMMEKNESIK